MTALRPFFLLLGRASVFWLGVFALFFVSMIVAGVATPDARLGLYLDATLLANLWFPAAAGWLVGLVIQEFQHTSFAHHLPGVRSRFAAGYLTTGLVVTVVVVGLIARVSSTSLSLPLMFVLGLGAYCASGALQDPLSSWITSLNAVLVLLVVVRSRDLARLAGEHPWIAAMVSLGLGAAGFRRLFARSTFRRKPFRLTSPLPGRFSLERGRDYERRWRLKDRPKTTGWRAGYLGGDSWAWVRAEFHEAHGALGWKGVSKAISRLWGLGLLFLIYAWVDKGELGFGEALGRSIYDALFRSPHVAQFGKEGGPYLMVVIVIAAAGVVGALFKPVALGDAMAYPLSRLQRAQVTFRGGLVDAAMFLFVLGLGLYATGHLMGLLVGYEVRFDFMPFYFRVLMVTLILMPLGHWGRLGLQAAARRKAENTVVAMAFGVVGFVIAVCLGVFVLPLIFVSPIPELAALVAVFLVSQFVYRNQLMSYYRTADLA